MGDEPARYEVDGKVYYRASSLGMCDKMIVALAQGYEPMQKPEWFQKVLDEGKDAEAEINAMWEEQSGYETFGSQKRLELEVLPDVYIVGHPDGETGDATTLREYKKFRDSTWPVFQRKGVEISPAYPWQVSAYMFAGEYETCEFVGGHWDGEKITEVYPHVLHNPPIPLKGLRLRVAKLEGMINESVDARDVACQIRQYPCPMYYLHDEEETPEGVELHEDDVLSPLVDQFKELNEGLAEMRKDVKKREERIKELKAGMQGWLEWNEVGDGSEATVKMNDGSEMTMKWHKQHRDGYEVKPTDYTTVTVKLNPKGKK